MAILYIVLKQGSASRTLFQPGSSVSEYFIARKLGLRFDLSIATLITFVILVLVTGSVPALAQSTNWVVGGRGNNVLLDGAPGDPKFDGTNQSGGLPNAWDDPRWVTILTGESDPTVHIQLAPIRVQPFNPYLKQPLGPTSQLNSTKMFAGASGGGSVEINLNEYRRALMFSEMAGDKVGLMNAHTALAQLFVEQGNFTKALEQISAAEPLVNATGDPTLRVDLLRVKFAAHMQSGDFEAALSDNRELMPIFRARGDDGGQAETLLSSGWGFQSLGDIQKAIACYESALTAFQNAKDKGGQVRSQVGLGSLYQSIGQLGKAIDQYRAAEPSASRPQLARILISEAEMLSSAGKPTEALANYKKAASLINPLRDSDLQASILTGMGRVLMSMRVFVAAEADFVQARKIVENSPSYEAEAVVIASQGELNYWMAINSIWPGDKPERLRQSLKYYREAFSLMQKVGNQVGEIGLLTNSGLACEAMGEPKLALSFYLQALDRMEQLQTLARLEEYRANFASQSAALYGRAIQLELQEHHLEQAFVLSERARARTFLDQLGNTRIANANMGSSENLVREEQLRRENIMLDRQLGQLLSQPSPAINSAQLEEIRERLSGVRTSYTALLNQLKLANPAYASFLSISPITLGEAQKRLNPDTTIVSYFTLPDVAFAFVLTRNKFRVKKLEVTERQLHHDITVFRDFSSFEHLSPNLKSLYGSLIAPIRSELKTRNLVIVPYGVLHELPFAALTPDKVHFLGERYTISYLPSISTLAYIHPKPTIGPQRVLILANSQEVGFPKLSYAAEEARAVAALFDARTLSSKEATASSLIREASDFDILHLVAHFEIDVRDPMASRILLDGGLADESRLDMAEVYKLVLHKTDLVVLSGCQSESGKRTRGDDIVNFSRAFMYAGSSSVMASLWGVEDDATQLLMAAFYKHLSEGQSKAEALRSAQVDVREKYPMPFYWAGFVLNGDPGQAVQRN